jgi:hypothetical protein
LVPLTVKPIKISILPADARVTLPQLFKAKLVESSGIGEQIEGVQSGEDLVGGTQAAPLHCEGQGQYVGN